jgi:hypothetical protein
MNIVLTKQLHGTVPDCPYRRRETLDAPDGRTARPRRHGARKRRLPEYGPQYVEGVRVRQIDPRIEVIRQGAIQHGEQGLEARVKQHSLKGEDH